MRTLILRTPLARQQFKSQYFGFSTSVTAVSIGITQPSSHAALAAAVDNFVRAPRNPTVLTLGLNSIQAGESYEVWGSNNATDFGTLLASIFC